MACCLVYQEPNDRFFITTDSSDPALGFVISQERNSVMHPVSFAGQSLREFGKRFPTHEKEALALIEAIKQNHRFLLNQEFTVYTERSNFNLSEELKG